MCGPTASGKTSLSDEIAYCVSESTAASALTYVPTLVVDSMQVYKELPVITNQERERSAELVGVTSVIDDWTMAHHRSAVEEIINTHDGSPFVLDAGSGMYLNAILLDIDIAPKVSEKTRREAKVSSADTLNPRRFARKKELELAGAPTRGSIWSGSLRYSVCMIYLRPERDTLDSSINTRSGKLVRNGIEEAEKLMALKDEGFSLNPSVTSSIGVRELTSVISGKLSLEEAEHQVASRTRKLARRQIRWFDKLARTLKGILEGKAEVTIVSSRNELPSLNTMFDILDPWDS